MLLILSAVTELSHEASVNKTGLSSKFSGPVKLLRVVSPFNFMNYGNKNAKMSYCDHHKAIILLWVFIIVT